MTVYVRIQETHMENFGELRNLAGQKTDTQKSIVECDLVLNVSVES